MGRKFVLGLVALVLAVISVGAWAQSRRPTAPTVVPGVLLSGDLVGVRLTGRDRNGKVSGILVVKIDDQWVDVVSSMGRVPMTSK